MIAYDLESDMGGQGATVDEDPAQLVHPALPLELEIYMNKKGS